MSGKKRIRAAVIGVGYLGAFHAEKYSAMDGVELVGVVDSNATRAKEVADKCKTKAFASYEELFGKVDAVSVVTPTESHCKIGSEFLLRGVDALVEKPIASNLNEADALIEAAEKGNAVLQVGHLERFNAAVMALEGRVTEPLFIESRRLSPFPNRSTDVDVILDVMIHDIDIILSLVRSEVIDVTAIGFPVISDKVDFANARVTFANGCVASVIASRAAKERVRSVQILQHDSHIDIDYAHQLISLRSKRPTSGPQPFELVDEEIKIEKKDSLMEELKAFIKSCSERSRPLVSGADGRSALELAGKIQRAVAKKGNWG